MGMSFSPMYQPVTSSTIKADGDMDISPYDLLATDVYADTMEATEFVGGVGNFSSTIADHCQCNYYGLNGTLTLDNTGHVYAEAPAIGLTRSTSVQSITIPNYDINTRIKIADGLYITNIEGEMPNTTTRTIYVSKGDQVATSSFSFKKASDATYTSYTFYAFDTRSFTVEIGETYNYYFGGNTGNISGSLQALPTYYVAVE